VASTEGRLILYFLPGYTPELNPNELVWSHVKRTGAARTPLRKGEKLSERIEMQLAAIKKMLRLVGAFFKTPRVAYIID
jgi:transposase